MAMLQTPLPRFKPGSSPNPVAQAMVDPVQPQQPPAAFVWGENGQQMSPEDVARKRQIAQAMMQEGSSYAPVQHWTQGLARVAEALAGGLEERRANEADAANKKGARDQMAAYMAEVGDPTIDAKVHREHGVSLMDNPYLGEGGRAVVAQDFKAPSEHWTTEDVNKDGIPDRQINSITGEVKAVAEPALTFEQKQQLAREGASRSTTTINTGGGTDKQIYDTLGESATSARSAATGLSALGEARKALNQGGYFGAGADYTLGLAKLAKAVGVGSIDTTNKIAATESFRSAIAPQVAAIMKATVGSTQISNSDREFAAKAAGGDINLDPTSISHLLDIMERSGREAIRIHNDKLNRVYPDGKNFGRERALFEVADPTATAAPAIVDHSKVDKILGLAK